MFSDIVLPWTYRWAALAAELQSRYPRTPVLLTTRYAGQLSQLPYPVLRKPYDLVKLDDAVKLLARDHVDADFQSQDVKTFRQWLLDELGTEAQPGSKQKAAAENRLTLIGGNARRRVE